MKYSLLSVFLFISLHYLGTLCTPVPLQTTTLTNDDSTDTTCNDPTTAVIYYEGYSPGRTAHTLQQHSSFVNANSQDGEDLQIQSAAFRAWNSPQGGTLILWRLAAVGSPTPDWIFMTTPTNTPPVVSGYSPTNSIIAYVYPTQICGSVPLYVLSFAATTDHYYTVDPIERQNLITFGWADEGITAFVLPV